jgi:preprotein translocase subunit YajC
MMIHWHSLLAQAAAPNGQAEMVKFIGMMVIMVFLMYFVIIRPQRVRQKQLVSLIEKIKPGDKVLTASGIVGVIISVKEKTVSIRSADTKLEVLKSTISEITEKAGEVAA